MADIEFVRVKDKGTGHEYSLVKSAYDADPGPYQLLKKPATESDGTPLPPKHNLRAGGGPLESLSNETGRPADTTEKEKD